MGLGSGGGGGDEDGEEKEAKKQNEGVKNCIKIQSSNSSLLSFQIYLSSKLEVKIKTSMSSF